MSVKRICWTVSAVIAAALLGAIGGWLALTGPASAQSALPAPNNLEVSHGENPGDVLISWDTVAGASGYRVAWVNRGAAQRTIMDGGTWPNGLQSIEVADQGTGTQSVTINGLTAGTEFAIAVGSKSSPGASLNWTEWKTLTPQGQRDVADVHDVVQIQSAALGVARHANALVAIGSIPTQPWMPPEVIAANGQAISAHKESLNDHLAFLDGQGPAERVAHIRMLVDRLGTNADSIQAGRLPLLAAMGAENMSWEHVVLSSVAELYPAADASVDNQFYDLASNVHDISEDDILRYTHTNSLYANTGLGHTLLVVASLLDFHPYVAGIEEIYDSVAGRLARDVEYLRDDHGAGLDPEVVALAERLRDAGGADGQTRYFELLVTRLKMTEQEHALIMENAQVLSHILDQVDALATEARGLDAPAVPQVQPLSMMDPGITADEVHFGQSAVLEGPSAALGSMMKLGIEAAFEEANRAGGVHNRQIKLTTLNDDYEVDAAVYNTQELINIHQVFALIGEVGTPTSRAALPVAEASGVPFIGAFTGAQLLRGDHQTGVLNYRASYHQEIERMVGHLAGAGISSVAVLYQSDSYGIDGLNGVKMALAERDDMELVGSWYYLRNTDAVQAAAFRIADTEPKPEAVIIIGTHEPAARLIEKLRMKLGSRYDLCGRIIRGQQPVGCGAGWRHRQRLCDAGRAPADRPGHSGSGEISPRPGGSRCRCCSRVRFPGGLPGGASGHCQARSLWGRPEPGLLHGRVQRADHRGHRWSAAAIRAQ